MLLLSWNARKRIVGIDQSPVLRWRTIISEGVKVVVGSPFGEIKPLALATIKILPEMSVTSITNV
jgi:hypothetical protein